MNVYFTNSTSYVEISTNSFIDTIVFESISEYYKNANREIDSKKSIYVARMEKNIIDNHISCVIFSALAIEGMINLLGSVLFEKNFFEKYLDRLPTIDKLGAIYEKHKMASIIKGEKPIQNIKKLFVERDKYVHDKGKQVKTEEEYLAEWARKNTKYIPADAIKALFEFNDFYIKQFYDVTKINLVSDDIYNSWKRWNGSRKYSISEGLQYEGGIFPSLEDYWTFESRHLGYIDCNCIENKSLNKIQFKT